MSSHLRPEIKHIVATIEARSKQTRADYLASMPSSVTARCSISCSNLAHTTAIFEPHLRIQINQHKAPHLGIVSAYNDMLSAHQPFASFPKTIAEAAKTLGATTQVAGGTPAMCDGITQGRAGMELSLFSRDVIALSTSIALSHDVFDGCILLGVCDKIAPGLLMGALAFGQLPAVFIPAGPMSTGLSHSEKSRIRGLVAEGKATTQQQLLAEEATYHSPGTCTFYGTANSNQVLLDAMGLQWPGAAFAGPNSDERQTAINRSVQGMIAAAGNTKLCLSQLVTAASLCNALVALLASGGSSNHSIHWLAVARAAGFIITWEDLDNLAKHVPLLCRLYPNGDADVNDFHAAGGTSWLIHELIEAGYLDGQIMTLWGKPLQDVCEKPAIPISKSHNPYANIIRCADDPFLPHGGLRLLQGNLGRAICKTSALNIDQQHIKAPCAVFHSQQEVEHAFKANTLNRDVVVVLRFQGPSANGMPELHQLMPMLGVLQQRGHRVALLTDGRLSGASGKVLAALHVVPEAIHGGPLAQLQNGDIVEINAHEGTLHCHSDFSPKTATPKPTTAIQNGNLGRNYFSVWRTHISPADEGASLLFPAKPNE